MYKQLLKYYGKHPLYAICVNFIAGIGVGILLSRPLGIHPVRYGIVLLLIAGAGKLYALTNKVK